MAIRFHCPQCDQLLSIASRKAGTDIECPTCGVPQTVPEEQSAKDAMLLRERIAKRRPPPPPPGGNSEEELESGEKPLQSLAPPSEEDYERENTSFREDEDVDPTRFWEDDEEPPPITAQPLDHEPPPHPPEEGKGLPKPPTELDSPHSPPRNYENDPFFPLFEPPKGFPPPLDEEREKPHSLTEGMSRFRAKRPLSWLGWSLFFVFAFLTGWWTHQWLFSEGEPKATTSQEGKEGEEVALIEGKLFYQDHAGNRHPDDGAVVMLLPAEDPPDTPLPVNQLHPKKPMPGDNHPTIRRWKEAGAYYLRTREDGTFALRLDDPGTYDVLMISANASRLTDELDEVTEQRLKPYFAIPKLPIGTYRYAVREMDLSTGTEPIEHDFGSSELVIPELRGEDRDQAK